MYRKPRRILLKFGSGILTRPRANALDDKQFRGLTTDVAQLVRGGCECIIVSSGAVAAGMRVDGLKDHAGKRIPMIADIADAARFVRTEKSRFSVGGMVSKLDAVKLATAGGIPTVIANGRRAGIIPRIAAGEGVGTLFPVWAQKPDARLERRE